MLFSQFPLCFFCIRHAQIEELGAIINMPVMSNSKYQLLHNELATHFNEISWEEIELAGKEEAKIAIQNNEVDADDSRDCRRCFF